MESDQKETKCTRNDGKNLLRKIKKTSESLFQKHLETFRSELTKRHKKKYISL